MNFWSDSVKIKSQTQNENFYFDIETPRGHFFAVLDFAPHDYANLDATLKRKLQTIVGSFDSVPRFSTDLFLGFLAKEINNFLHDLGKQSPGPQLFCSGALCLVSGNRLAYFLCGDKKLNILRRGRSLSSLSLLSLRGNGPAVPGPRVEVSGAEPNGIPSGAERTNKHSEQLGVRHWDAPLTDRVPAFTLHDDDVVLIITHGVEETFERPEFSTMLQSLRSSDPKSICDAVMKNNSASLNLGMVLVISGPYDQYVDPLLADLSKAFDSLEERVNALTESGQRNGVVPDLMEKTLEAELEQRISPQIEELKDGLRGKANSIDILELNEILRNLGVVLASKADTAEVLALQRDILKLGIVSNENQSHGRNGSGNGEDEITRLSAQRENRGPFAGWETEDSNLLEEEATALERGVGQIPRQSYFGLKTALLVFVIAIAGAFIGAWLQSRVLKKNPEVWSVKTSGNQIWINRLDQSGQGSVTLNVAAPLRSRGEQTFSSFADVKHYIDTITSPEPSPDQTSQVPQPIQTVENKQADPVSKVIAKPDDSLKRPSQPDKTNLKKMPELNATPSKKPETKTTNKNAVPSSSSPASAASLQRDRRVLASSVATMTQVTVVAGDTLEKLARRYQTTSEELRKLNPRINERGVIQPNQKILVPAPSSPKDSKGRRLMLVKQAH